MTMWCAAPSGIVFGLRLASIGWIVIAWAKWLNTKSLSCKSVNGSDIVVATIHFCFKRGYRRTTFGAPKLSVKIPYKNHLVFIEKSMSMT